MSLREPVVVVVSLETPDGGKAGVRTEVSRQTAAKMLVEGRARLASEQEAHDFQEEKVEAKRAADQIAAANRVQVTVMPVRGGLRPAKE
ncbi:MAG: hypothetical protein M1541_09860 [Acidobacteria bacterium]|nr:hypothetical protein [Acidobacteriota bacterium]